MATFLSPHFTLEELTATQVRTASNTPGPNEVRNLTRLAGVGLEPIRLALGPQHVNSGYRSPEVNRIVGGAPTSYHQKGLAGDLTPLAPSVTFKRIMEFVLHEAGFDWDQVIFEFGRWVHIGLPEIGAKGRRQALMIFSPGKYELYDPSRVP